MIEQQLFIIDDHKIVRDGLKAMLLGRSDVKVVGEASSLAEAQQKLSELEVDLLFVDLKLPDGNGSQFLEAHLKQFPAIKAAILTADPNKSDLERAQKAGVTGFLTKDIEKDEYYKAIDQLIAGKRFISPAFADVMMNEAITLTPREVDVLKGFADGLTYKEIGSRFDISPRTVETHKNHLLEKFGTNSIVEMVRIAIREGLIEA